MASWLRGAIIILAGTDTSSAKRHLILCNLGAKEFTFQLNQRELPFLLGLVVVPVPEIVCSSFGAFCNWDTSPHSEGPRQDPHQVQRLYKSFLPPSSSGLEEGWTTKCIQSYL